MKNLVPEDALLLHQVKQVIGGIVDEVIRQFAPGACGVYFTVADEDGNPLFTIPAGSNFFKRGLPIEKHRKYHAFSREKAFRLGWHPEHLTSRESMDEAQAQYPGATRIAGSRIISTSGLSPARLDEIVDIKVALAVGRYIPGVMTRIHTLCRP